MKLSTVFDVFSRRGSRQPPRKTLVRTFRNRVLMLCTDTFGRVGNEVGGGDFRAEFWSEVHRRLQYIYGEPRLSDNPHVESPQQDAITFLRDCRDEHFLDFVESIFRTESSWRISAEDTDVVREINRFFEIDNLPYSLTDFAREEKDVSFFGHQGTASVVTSYPQVICREDQVLHVEAIEPALTLLSERAFGSANDEFRRALEDYRKGDYNDCLVKCWSAFESVMKIACERSGWPYGQSATASVLVKTILRRSQLPSFLEQPLIVVGTLRNQLGSSHGAGDRERSVSRTLAKFAVNVTASGILLIAEETA